MQIEQLKIYTSRLEQQAQFYSEVLNLNVLSKSDNNISFQIGKSILILEYRPKATPYHFAINIPANKEHEALNWLKLRVRVLKNGNNEIQNFDSWNAKAIYFYDKDQNIVELIARKNLSNATDKEFNSNLFLNISEIGIPSDDIEKQYTILNKQTGIEIFDGSFERFCAIGDDNGLFICIDKNNKEWFLTNDKSFPSDFWIKITERGKSYVIEYKDTILKVATNNG